jgi:hypothetical protein
MMEEDVSTFLISGLFVAAIVILLRRTRKLVAWERIPLLRRRYWRAVVSVDAISSHLHGPWRRSRQTALFDQWLLWPFGQAERSIEGVMARDVARDRRNERRRKKSDEVAKRKMEAAGTMFFAGFMLLFIGALVSVPTLIYVEVFGEWAANNRHWVVPSFLGILFLLGSLISALLADIGRRYVVA